MASLQNPARPNSVKSVSMATLEVLVFGSESLFLFYIRLPNNTHLHSWNPGGRARAREDGIKREGRGIAHRRDVDGG
jgi:hypothetical protein